MVETEATLLVEVELVGPLRRPWPERQRSVSLPAGATVATLLTQLGYSTTDRRYLSVLVNGARALPAAALGQGDQVIVALMVGGG